MADSDALPHQSQRESRFVGFNSEELAELTIALDHRRHEAATNMYVYVDVVELLLAEVERAEATDA